MSIASVITQGLGSFGSPSFIIRLGLGVDLTPSVPDTSGAADGNSDKRTFPGWMGWGDLEDEPKKLKQSEEIQIEAFEETQPPEIEIVPRVSLDEIIKIEAARLHEERRIEALRQAEISRLNDEDALALLMCLPFG